MQVLDGDKDGFIGKEDLSKYLSTMGEAAVSPAAVDAMITEADTDNDGKLNIAEFAVLANNVMA